MSVNPFIHLEITAIVYRVALLLIRKKRGG